MSDIPIKYQNEVKKLKKSPCFCKHHHPFKNKKDLYTHITKDVIPGLWLEFGVWMGATITMLADLCPEHIHGFDSFYGLPEDWYKSNVGNVLKKEAFSTNGIIPKHLFDNPKIIIHAGLFENTLPMFIENHVDNCALIHIDCDLYSSTKTIIDNLQNKIVPGTIIIFDELYNYPNYYKHEMKCLLEQPWEYEYIGYTNEVQASIKIIEKKDNQNVK